MNINGTNGLACLTKVRNTNWASVLLHGIWQLEFLRHSVHG